ncbi:hypothetical protein Rs2_43678 [Raphanus sativus]|nr:hypothetical protein Rs2_43678 [Raphanus sativus]
MSVHQFSTPPASSYNSDHSRSSPPVLYDSRNIKKGGEFMGVMLLFLNEKNSVIFGFIPVGRVNHYRPSLKSGSIVSVYRHEDCWKHDYKPLGIQGEILNRGALSDDEQNDI